MSPDLSLPVQDEHHCDGGPEHGAQPAAAQAHLQPSGDVQEVFVWPSPGLGPAVSVGSVLSKPLPRQLVMIKVKPGVVVRVSEQAPAPVAHTVDLGAQGQAAVQMPPSLVLKLSEIDCLDFWFSQKMKRINLPACDDISREDHDSRDEDKEEDDGGEHDEGDGGLGLGTKWGCHCGYTSS